MSRSFMNKAAICWLLVWFLSAIVFWLLDSRSVLPHNLPNALGWGFDAFGRDLLSTVLRASLVSTFFAASVVVLSLGAALILGASGALLPQTARFAFSRFLEIFLAFPSLIFALAFASIRGPGWDTLIFALAIGTLPSLTRLLHVRAQELLSEEYLLAARSLGASPARLAIRHLVPELFAFGRVKIPNLFSSALIAEATLSFLGIGAPIGRDTWGSLLAQGKDYLFESPHIALGVGFPLFLTVLSLQLLTEGKKH